MLLLLSVLACTDVPIPVNTDDVPGETGDGEPPSPLRLITYNLESGDAEIGSLIDVVTGFDSDIWVFQEVYGESWRVQLADALAHDSFMGSTGGSDRIVITWSPERFEVRETRELRAVNSSSQGRSPLMVRLTDTESGQDFTVVSVHLFRSSPGVRFGQSQELSDWAARQSEPVIMLGDFNYDWDIPTGQHDAGYDALIDGSGLSWVEPVPLHPTQCSRAYQSVLDFTFVSSDVLQWQPTSEVLRRENVHCEDNEQKSDHRPVSASLLLPRVSK